MLLTEDIRSKPSRLLLHLDHVHQKLIAHLQTKFVVSLKYLSKFWKSLDLPSINCKTGLDLAW